MNKANSKTEATKQRCGQVLDFEAMAAAGGAASGSLALEEPSLRSSRRKRLDRVLELVIAARRKAYDEQADRRAGGRPGGAHSPGLGAPLRTPPASPALQLAVDKCTESTRNRMDHDHGLEVD